MLAKAALPPPQPSTLIDFFDDVFFPQGRSEKYANIVAWRMTSKRGDLESSSLVLITKVQVVNGRAHTLKLRCQLSKIMDLWCVITTTLPENKNGIWQKHAGLTKATQFRRISRQPRIGVSYVSIYYKGISQGSISESN